MRTDGGTHTPPGGDAAVQGRARAQEAAAVERLCPVKDEDVLRGELESPANLRIHRGRGVSPALRRHRDSVDVERSPLEPSRQFHERGVAFVADTFDDPAGDRLRFGVEAGGARALTTPASLRGLRRRVSQVDAWQPDEVVHGRPR
jgi:hypothetical protein